MYNVGVQQEGAGGRSCANCGAALSPISRICPQCGTIVVAREPQPLAPEPEQPSQQEPAQEPSEPAAPQLDDLGSPDGQPPVGPPDEPPAAPPDEPPRRRFCNSSGTA